MVDGNGLQEMLVELEPAPAGDEKRGPGRVLRRHPPTAQTDPVRTLYLDLFVSQTNGRGRRPRQFASRARHPEHHEPSCAQIPEGHDDQEYERASEHHPPATRGYRITSIVFTPASSPSETMRTPS